MIAPEKRTESCPAWHRTYLAMVHTIRDRARFAFRHFDPEARDEAVQQVLVSTFLAFGRLVEQSRSHLASPSALARFAIAQVRVGRCMDVRLNSNEVLSRYAQRRRGFRVQQLAQSGSHEPSRKLLIEDRGANPAELALTRVDFEDWLTTLTPRLQIVANALAEGHTVTQVANQLQISVGRVSQGTRSSLGRFPFRNWPGGSRWGALLSSAHITSDGAKQSFEEG